MLLVPNHARVHTHLPWLTILIRNFPTFLLVTPNLVEPPRPYIPAARVASIVIGAIGYMVVLHQSVLYCRILVIGRLV